MGIVLKRLGRMSMSNKLKNAIKNKWVSVKGLYKTSKGTMFPTTVNCIITNDEVGKTLSVGNEQIMFTIPFEAIEEYLK